MDQLGKVDVGLPQLRIVSWNVSNVNIKIRNREPVSKTLWLATALKPEIMMIQETYA